MPPRWSRRTTRITSARLTLAAATLIVCATGCRGAGSAQVAANTVRHRALYACSMAAGPVTIDGALDEEVWRDTQAIREFGIPVTHRVPVHGTEGRIMWDRRFLYVGFIAEDPDVRSVFTERDSDTYRDDVLEIFMKTGPTVKSHYNFEINALGTVKDEYHTPAQPFQTGWNCEGIRIAAKVVGTLNDSTDFDERWQLEIAIPFASLPSLRGRAPGSGDVWLFHLARIDRSANLPDGKELTSTAPLDRKWFHDSERWLPLIFAGVSTPTMQEAD